MKWRIWSICAFLILAINLSETKPIDDPFGGAICENTYSAFFVSDNTNVIWDGKVLNIVNVTEDQCKEYCINNRDAKGRSILCASFTYDHNSFRCSIYRHKSLPDGKMGRKYDPGNRYFEKFCISEEFPLKCANTNFVRADESIIKGYAKNTSIVPSMEECASQCMHEEFDCKSAMYFYEEGECITNVESAMSRPDDFSHPDDGDKVVYFQNGCTREYLRSIRHDLGKAKVEPEVQPEATNVVKKVPDTLAIKSPVEPKKEEKNQNKKIQEEVKIGGNEEEASKPDQTKSQNPKPLLSSVELPVKEEQPKQTRVKTGALKKFEEFEDDEQKQKEFVVDPTTPSSETSINKKLQEMEKELTNLVKESSDAAESLNENDNKEHDEIEFKSKSRELQQQEDQDHLNKSDEEAMKEIQKIREMLRERKFKKRKQSENRKKQNQEVQRKKLMSRRKQLKEEEKREGELRQESQEKKPQEAAAEEQSEETLRQRTRVFKKQFGIKQLTNSFEDLREPHKTEASEESQQKEHASEDNREPLPVARQDGEGPTRFELKTNFGDNKRINIKPIKSLANWRQEKIVDPGQAPGEEEEGEQEVAGYFSKWGNWTKCTQAGERRIRRRKCLDLKKCKGALMQVSYCSKKILHEKEEKAQIEQQKELVQHDDQQQLLQEPVRQPLPVTSGSWKDGHPPGIMPPNLANKELKPLPAGAPGKLSEVWSPWLGVCQQFASTQPCKNGKIIGFESRECIAKNPKQCKGPFFRYCTLPC